MLRRSTSAREISGVGALWNDALARLSGVQRGEAPQAADRNGAAAQSQKPCMTVLLDREPCHDIPLGRLAIGRRRPLGERLDRAARHG